MKHEVAITFPKSTAAPVLNNAALAFLYPKIPLLAFTWLAWSVTIS